ncbi:hypothetical protein SM089_003017 [Cronobacter sakazakii]|nr:hypothetical protein [Cronobacter sakazakii]ELY4731225.1 hypothetical protein [Cronobacter sakazakii]ELY4772744.1 hypothetical protein [Cronobacter sakazakii]ELY4787476.1 hypothetical protein [Cronobacter sakazakii]ELY4793195.1 hypothetical protein [Cronobacter sakazakii]
MSEISEAIKQKAAEMESENDLITIPRGLLGAALAVIKRPERDSANVIELLRYYAFAKEAPVALRERAEPVAWRHDDGPFASGALTRSKPVAESWIANGWKVTPLYAEPPAPVVPDAAKVGEMAYLGTSEPAYVSGWNACRAAMLATPGKD